MDISTMLEKIVTFYETSDSFTYPADFNKISHDSKNYNEDEAALFAAFDSLEKEDIVKCRIKENNAGYKTYTWVITESRINEPCVVILSRDICKNISQVINSFLPMLDLNLEQQSDEKNISEAEIILLLQCINVFANQLQSLQNQLNKKDKKSKGGNNLSDGDSPAPIQ